MDLKDLQIKVGGVQDDVTDIALSPEHSKKRTLNSTDMSMSSSSSQSSKLLFPASKKAKETETISKNNKNPEIDSLLEAAALANDVSGTGNQFCFSYCNKFESMKNESAKIKSSMNFCLTIRVRSGNECAEVRESGCRCRENAISEKDLCIHQKKGFGRVDEESGKG